MQMYLMEFGSVFWEALQDTTCQTGIEIRDLRTGAKHMVGQEAFWVEEVTNSELTVLLHSLMRACFSDLIGSRFHIFEKTI